MLEISGLTWAVTIAVIVALLALDLALAALRPHRSASARPSPGRCSTSSWPSCSASGSPPPTAADFGPEYFAGYIVEKSLSVDNLFVFVIIMATFAVPEEHQHKVLTFGIVLALIMRAIFIALGATLISLFSFMFLLFGAPADLHGRAAVPAPRRGPRRREQRLVVKAARRMLPVTDDYVDGQITTKVDGRRVVTPLLVVLIAIGSIDLLFALDSIPAVFGVTEEAYIVFAANAFALLGLRALFFLVKGLLDRLVYLSTGLALILAFIGAKLILHWAHVDIDERTAGDPTPGAWA